MLGQLLTAEPYVESHVGPPHEWSERQWLAATTLPRFSQCTHALLLNDDLQLCPRFLDVLARVIEARPTHVVNLYNAHRVAGEAVKAGLAWLTSVDGLIGNAYVLPIQALRAFLDWRSSALMPDTVETLSEDQILNLWCMSHDVLIWHTVPSLVDHDTSVPSCYGNTQIRRPTVGFEAVDDYKGRDRMREKTMLDVNWDTDALHVGRVFEGNHRALLTRVKGPRGPLVEKYYRLAGDVL